MVQWCYFNLCFSHLSHSNPVQGPYQLRSQWQWWMLSRSFCLHCLSIRSHLLTDTLILPPSGVLHAQQSLIMHIASLLWPLGLSTNIAPPRIPSHLHFSLLLTTASPLPPALSACHLPYEICSFSSLYLSVCKPSPHLFRSSFLINCNKIWDSFLLLSPQNRTILWGDCGWWCEDTKEMQDNG